MISVSFEELKKLNVNKIKDLEKKIKKDSTSDVLNRQLEINKKIDNLFQEGESIFFKLKMEDSLKILQQILNKDDAMKVYLEFISPNSYSNLVDKFEV